ncbi:SAM-dependent methyltransferase [Culicoidibacter larvae]|uniref:Methyltransferase domain-containing protein n=1 Tax=Culicoidibacter larvae TaxID=2579976 RepID=A0A5R8QDU5_9FIRM|nr:class I SAM-dependent methyltransferase [Culicoidibacter larvae]TLG75358.1 methyltransferase domain-containing protein [Culicoidibacter larvae]
MKTNFTDNFIKEHNNFEFLLETMMGPNSMRVMEVLLGYLPEHPSGRILDLGCGAGLSTLYLAKNFAAQIVAADLWVDPSENYRRFIERGIAEQVMPVRVDASRHLPFADSYFDYIVSVDAYHYFGEGVEMLENVAALVKPGGYIVVAVPGLQTEFKSVPEALKPFWIDGEMHMHSVTWWRELWSQCDAVEVVNVFELDCHQQAWNEWLLSPNPYAQGDVHMMAAEDGKYFNHVAMIAKVL